MPNENLKIIKGKPLYKSISQESLGILLYKSLKANYSNESPALFNIVTNESITFKELFVQTCKLGEWMREQGLQQNDVIMICCENIKEYFIPVIASFYSCIIVANASPFYTDNEIQHALNLVKPKIVFCTKTCKQKFETFKSKIHPFRVIEMETLTDLLENVKVDLLQFKPKNCNVYEQTAVIMFSSGTTGLFKGVMLTHRNYLARFNQTEDPRIAATTNESVITFLPFYLAYGFVYTLMLLGHGLGTKFMPKFDLTQFLQTIEKYKITMLPLVPPIMVVLAKHPDVRKYDLSSVNHILCGAAPLGPETEQANRRIFPNAIIRQAYGLTEVTFAATMFLNDELHNKPGSCGTVIPGTQAIVRDSESGDTLGPYEVGEFCIKSETVMKGYIGNLQATIESFTKDGWLRTGDMCYYDKDNYFYIVDRLKELIKYKATQIAPAELEALLLTHSDVLDAAVIGKPDELAGEVPLAFVVRKIGSVVTEEEIAKFVEKQVSPHKRLRGGVTFTNVIPKSVSGKILRRELRELIKRKSNL